jgi:hypothetical protein
MKTPREILSDLQQLSRTCETPEDGILKALKIIGDYGAESWRQGMTDAAAIVHSVDDNALELAIKHKRDAAQPNTKLTHD